METGGRKGGCTYHYAAVVETADDGCAGAGGFGEGDASGVKCSVTVMV